MFQNRVLNDLSIDLKKMNETGLIFETHLRSYLSRIITEMHTPKESIPQWGKTIFIETVRATFEEGNISDEETEKIFRDPYYKKRMHVKEAQNLVNKLEVEELYDFCTQCIYNPLETVVPQWRPKFKVKRIFNRSSDREGEKKQVIKYYSKSRKKK